MTSIHSPAHEIHTEGRTIRWASHYDLSVKLLLLGQDRSLRRRTVELAGVRPGEAVLDVGCGTGDLTLLAGQRAGPEGKAVGIDPAPEMIEVARRKAAAGAAAVVFQSGAVEALPFPDGSFDVVLSSLMMHHLPPDLKRRGLAEIRRVLREPDPASGKSGGRLVVVDMRRPTGMLSHMALHLMWHGGLRHGVQDLAPLMQAAGFTHIETGNVWLGILGYARGWAGAATTVG
jgi:demethylmenaquinone methyltransferase/2-methoxy-6-polyprenyl-1,4-benzoquinol methylase/phosphoethanolamine N-methyltransferase